MVFEHRDEHPSQWKAIGSVASKIGCQPESLRLWVRQDERDVGLRDGLTTTEREKMKALEREVKAYQAKKVRAMVGLTRFSRHVS